MDPVRPLHPGQLQALQLQMQAQRQRQALEAESARERAAKTFRFVVGVDNQDFHEVGRKV